MDLLYSSHVTTELILNHFIHSLLLLTVYLILKALVNKSSTLLCLVWVAKDVTDLETEGTFYFFYSGVGLQFFWAMLPLNSLSVTLPLRIWSPVMNSVLLALCWVQTCSSIFKFFDAALIDERKINLYFVEINTNHVRNCLQLMWWFWCL